jgi:SpoVK/Ycf46/Vps4 family AAA+-type ATPase
MDRLVYVGPPDAVARAHIFRLHLSKMPHDNANVTAEDLAGRSIGFVFPLLFLVLFMWTARKVAGG